MHSIQAIDVWTQVPVASRTVEVNTKTGFSLTAGSYSVRASSVQGGTQSIANGAGPTNTSAISSVTTTRTTLDSAECSGDTNTVGASSGGIRIDLTNATTVTGTRENTSGVNNWSFRILELF